MSLITEELTFYRASEGRSRLPSCSDDPYSFFKAPFYASEEAIRTYGRINLLICLALLQKHAKKTGGLDSTQTFWDINDQRPGLLFVEDADTADRETNVMLKDIGSLRTVAMLKSEYSIYSYLEEYSDEWLNIYKIKE